MSMNPVTTKEFNSALAGTMAGGIVVAQQVGSLISGLSRYHWINHSSASYCRFVVELSARTRVLTLELAETFSSADLQKAKGGLTQWADDSHDYLSSFFAPDRFREMALDRLRFGGCPKDVAHECVTEISKKLFDYLDKIQEVRMKPETEEWRRVEKFKKDLVNYWSQNGFDISRPYGREHISFWGTLLGFLGKCVLYSLLSMMVVSGGIAIAYKLGL